MRFWDARNGLIVSTREINSSQNVSISKDRRFILLKNFFDVRNPQCKLIDVNNGTETEFISSYGCEFSQSEQHISYLTYNGKLDKVDSIVLWSIEKKQVVRRVELQLSREYLLRDLHPFQFSDDGERLIIIIELNTDHFDEKNKVMREKISIYNAISGREMKVLSYSESLFRLHFGVDNVTKKYAL